MTATPDAWPTLYAGWHTYQTRLSAALSSLSARWKS